MNKRMLGLFLSLLLASGTAQATLLFTVTGQLTGDIRADNPDGLIVDVKVTVDDTTPDQASWTIDINSPLHPNIKLDEFYFNLVGLGTDYSFSDFDPTGWAVSTPATVQGAGGTTFLFETLDPAGQPNADDVTNTQDLTFLMTKLTGNILATDFSNATTALSNDAGSGQMGAHLQGLTVNNTTCPSGNCDDFGSVDGGSGFAFGDYTVTPNTDIPGGIPEPSILALLGIGLLGMGAAGYRRRCLHLQ